MLHEGAVTDCHLNHTVQVPSFNLPVFCEHRHPTTHILAKDLLEAIRGTEWKRASMGGLHYGTRQDVHGKLLALLGLSALTGFVCYLLALPPIRRMPKRRRVQVDGVTDIRDTVTACRLTGLQGWDLVAYAQHLATRKMTYSRLNPWDTPAQAFARGLGYCLQQALALNEIYDGLGIDTRVVFATRCTFPPKVVDGFCQPELTGGHTWVRVRIGSDERVVCPGSLENRSGNVQFHIDSAVHPLLL